MFSACRRRAASRSAYFKSCRNSRNSEASDGSASHIWPIRFGIDAVSASIKCRVSVRSRSIFSSSLQRVNAYPAFPADSEITLFIRSGTIPGAFSERKARKSVLESGSVYNTGARLLIVSNKFPVSAHKRINITKGGGSSNVFKNAFCAFAFISSASSII